MKYIFDFDRVLYATDALIDFINQHNLQDTPRGRALETALDEHNFDWESLVADSAKSFLASHLGECAIVSSSYSRRRGDNNNAEGEDEFQEIKLKRSGVASLVNDQYRITRESKAEAYKEFISDDSIVLDDEIVHLREAEQLGARLVWFRTKHNVMGATPEGKPEHIEGGSVTSFAQFVKLDEEWKKKV